jgi:peptidoglycan/xylan/chitin deacetylase (PgdA/CDA1 family)
VSPSLQSFAATLAPASPVVVTFTFDDDTADTVSAAPIMQASGMHGTYYTNSGTIGLPGYQTRANLASLYAAGNEIAGHTVNHPDLTTLPTSEVQRQICVDRDTLLSWGYPVQNFAYPFAATNNTIDGIAQACGYNSARNLGDIQSRFGCAGCGFAESIPPSKPFELAALDEVDNTWTLADLESTVTNAQNNGGGWVILTFHHVCDGNCDSLAVTPALFTQFVQWLATQSANGTTVKTVAQVIGGTTKPAVTVPPVTTTATVTNPSLETLTAGTNLPTCWAEAGYGTNTATYSTVSPGHTGNIAARLVVTGYTDGDAKVMPSLDLGTCSPSVVPGNAYQLGAWYQSTANTQFEVYLRTTGGAWVYWDSSPWFSPATPWTHATWNTQPIPAGYDGIDFGLNLFSNGTLTTDDYSLAPAVTPLATTATINPAAPDGANGWYKSQPTVTLSASNTGSPTTTQYSLDGGTTWLTYTTPVTIPTNRTTFEYRSSTASQTEAAQTITFAVDTDLPTVIAAFDGNRTYSAFGSDPTSGPNLIQFSKDAGATWNTYTGPTATDNGSLALQFRAIDVAGNISPVVSISEGAITTATVSPAGPDGLVGWYKTHPTVTLSAGTPGADQVTQYSYDGGATWATYTVPIVVPDGRSTVSYRTTGAGHIEATRAVGVFSVDTTLPVVIPVYGATTHSYSATATDAMSGVVSIEETINGGPWIPYPGPTTVSASMALQFRATDSAGNVSTVVPFTIGDPTIPTTTAAVTPSSPNGSAGWYTVDPSVLLAASATGGDAVTQYSFNGTTWITYAGAITVPAGASTLSYRTIAGGSTEATHTLSFTVDLDLPTVIPAFNSATRTWSATATDATSTVGGIQVRVPGGAWTAYAAPVAIGNASLSLEFRATDVAGNVSTVVSLKVGAISSASVAPAAPDGGTGWYKTAPVVTLSTGAASLGSPSADQVTQYSFNGSTWLTYSGALTVPQGAATLSYRTVGAGVTEATHTLAFKTDTIAPTVVPVFTVATRTYSATTTDASSGVASTQVSVNGGAWATYAGPTSVGTGSVSLQFRATDVAGNTSAPVSLSPGATITAAISPAAPNGANGWYVTAPAVTLTSGALQAGETVQYSFNGSTWSNYSSPVGLPTGTDTIQYRTSTASISAGSLSALVDLANPTATASFRSTTRTVTVKSADVGSGVASTLWRVGTGVWTTYKGPFTVGSAATTLQFESTDAAGRVSAVSSLSIPKGVVIPASTVTLSIDPASVPYLQAGTAHVTVTAGGKAALGLTTVTVDGKTYKSALLIAGKATVKLAKTLAVGSHAVVAKYAGGVTALAGTSATQTLNVSKATTTVTLSKVSSSTTLAAKFTSAHAKKPSARTVQVRVHIVGSKSVPKGKIVITVNGKKVKTVSLTAARSGKVVLTLPKVAKSVKKITVRAKFMGTKSLKSAKSKKLVIHLP